ncbi:hypothetical protein R1X32_07440 (plasmid) [Rhodococcus opacus]|uniref:hypothetical protein n=1 Tax=Rhodococcus opacus TaxID=37919 RepID=UPI0034D35C46
MQLEALDEGVLDRVAVVATEPQARALLAQWCRAEHAAADDAVAARPPLPDSDDDAVIEAWTRQIAGVQYALHPIIETASSPGHAA